MSIYNKVNAMEFDSSFRQNLERPPILNGLLEDKKTLNLSVINIFELGYICISFIYAGYKTFRILFVDKNFNDNKLYLVTNITNLLGMVLILFGFFSKEVILNKTALLCGVTCTLVSSISSIINFIIQEEFKKDLTSSILGCLGCVIGLFFSLIVVKQSTHI